MKNCILTFLLLYSSTIYSQSVLDAAFIFEKDFIYEPGPSSLNYLINETYHSVQNLKESEVLKNSLPIYPKSYLFSEPEYAYVRVIKTILFENNPQFSNTIQSSTHLKDNLVKKGDNYVIEKGVYKNLIINTHIPNRSRQFIGANINELIEGKSYPHWQQKYHRNNNDINNFISSYNLKKNNYGILEIGESYIPEQFSLKSFEFLIAEICDQEGSAFEDRNFTYEISTEKTQSIINNSSFSIKGLRIKEDYYLNPYTGSLTSKVIGIGIIGNNPDKELFWLYYPWQQWFMENSCTVSNNEIIDYCYIFDSHQYQCEINQYIPLNNYEYILEEYAHPNNPTDMDFVVKLDPLLAILLHQEMGVEFKNERNIIKKNGCLKSLEVEFKKGKAEGEISQHYNNGSLCFKGRMKNGKPDGVFQYYYSIGSKKAERTFLNGNLINTQYNYYPDGKQYMEYELANEFEIPISLTRYHDDGKILEKGNFKNGIPDGEWIYNLKCTKEAYSLLIKHAVFFSLATAPIYQFDGFSYNITYSHSSEKNCPALTLGKKSQHTCLDWELLFQKK